ncbi:endogenous retroviral envelope protein HEMO-like [Sphaerodactylus townsendi]|uniref:endogenous retroviral envelope protein HEMO-like n=1 Tax=Sphaerodactylus townsendi TaxID=933632 RepID=UPI0020267975|nr:endogenous retroviral envelope protein HEMO-like [Sphaerodactylus townsendi]
MTRPDGVSQGFLQLTDTQTTLYLSTKPLDIYCHLYKIHKRNTANATVTWEGTQNSILTWMAFMYVCTYEKTMPRNYAESCRILANAVPVSERSILLSEKGLYFICGNAGRKVIHVEWKGLCSFGTAVLELDKRKTISYHQVLNLGGRLPRAVITPTQTTIVNPLIGETHPWWGTFLRALIPFYGVAQIEKAVKNLSAIVEDGFQYTAHAVSGIQTELHSLADIVLQNRRLLDLLTAQQGGTCAMLGERCCLYVDMSGNITTDITQLRHAVHPLDRVAYTDPWDHVFGWLPGLGWVRNIVGICVLIAGLGLFVCCCMHCIPLLLSCTSSLASWRRRSRRPTGIPLRVVTSATNSSASPVLTSLL